MGLGGQAALAQQDGGSQSDQQQLLNQLKAQLATIQSRIEDLDRRMTSSAASDASKTPPPSATSAVVAAPTAPPEPAPEPELGHDHMVQIPGGPQLNIRGFADINLGFGNAANPLIFPLGAPAHTTFQLGELDLFLQSAISSKIHFISEIVLGSDATNVWGLDIERLQLTYTASPYFEISGGRYHTSIGYYNTAYHHGTWFQTATGRPFMYYFEDSGGILPVHSVGLTADGEVPGARGLGLHWIAEVGNGRSSSPDAAPVQNFLSDRTHKAFNLAVYARPEAVPGLQVGGSYYRDRLSPPDLPAVDQTIGSAYAVYIKSGWESLNEVVLISNSWNGSNRARTPLMYTQFSRHINKYRPYFRYQYVNGAAHDPINIFTGRYQGPSVGLRFDVSAFAALKLQYNRIYQRPSEGAPLNGLDAQMAFTF